MHLAATSAVAERTSEFARLCMRLRQSGRPWWPLEKRDERGG
jgi:hypothetical protein